MIKSFTLFYTIVLVFLFSILSIYIFQIKSLNYENIKNQHQYIQAKNHMRFLEEYTISLKNLNQIYKIEIKDNDFFIFGNINKKPKSNYEANLYIKSKLHNISLHKKLIIE
ncbi:MAG: hypothetical protein GY932_07390 [Arcobacter sp.]|nr:hypothetical protein [Arcobacter sp.]